MEEIRIKNKDYGISNFDQLEAYLTAEHAKGHRFLRYERKAFGNAFIFEACEPEAVVYQLDYNTMKPSERANYLQLCADCGWEYVGMRDNFYLFRKPAAADMQDEFFSDNKSKAEMCRRVMANRTVAICSAFCCLCMLSNCAGNKVDLSDLLQLIFSVTTVVLTLSIVLMMIVACSQLRGLRRIVQKYENPLLEFEKK